VSRKLRRAFAAGWDGKLPNCLAVMPGWNDIVRLCLPRAEILNGTWKIPAGAAGGLSRGAAEGADRHWFREAARRNAVVWSGMILASLIIPLQLIGGA